MRFWLPYSIVTVTILSDFFSSQVIQLIFDMKLHLRKEIPEMYLCSNPASLYV